MANEEHLLLLQQGKGSWNRWREQHPELVPDLSGADLSAIDLSEVDPRRESYDYERGSYVRINLSKADLHGALLIKTNLMDADLSAANLAGATLWHADLSGADLAGANLLDANLSGANFSGANLNNADLRGTILDSTIFTEANLSGANLNQTVTIKANFGNVDLRTVQGLETMRHYGPSTVGIDTIMRSEGNIPESFLRNTGIPNDLINYTRSLINHRPQYYSCFISYSSKDQEFVERLYADLQNKGVRCWFAPEDLRTGDKIRDRIDQSIHQHDKLLLVLSQHSVHSSWVEFEVEAAFAKETSGNTLMLFPIRLDSAVKESPSSWAAHIRRTRNMTDFSNWRQEDAYQKGLNRLLRDLQPDDPPQTPAF